MAFPQVDDLGITTSAAASSHECNFPTTVPADDLLLIIVAADGTGNSITLNESGWTTLYNAAIRNHASGWFWKKAVGDEDGGTFTIDLGSSDGVVAYCLVISGWDGTTAPEATTGVNNETATPNPGSLSPSWGAEDTLWLAGFTGDGVMPPVTAWPTSYTANQNDDSVAGGPSAAFATRENNTASEDPSTFTATSDGWHAVTLAVRPVSVSGNPHYYYAQQ